MVSVTTNFSALIVILIPPLRSVFRLNGTLPLQRPPPALPGHPVAAESLLTLVKNRPQATFVASHFGRGTQLSAGQLFVL